MSFPPPEVPDKEDMWRRMALGQFGNRFETWETEIDFLKAVTNGFNGLIGVRCVGKPGVEYRIPGYEHHTQLSPTEALGLGRKYRQLYNCPVRYYESSPDHLLTVQGEIIDAPHGFAVEYTYAKTYLRAAFKEQRLSNFHWVVPALIRKYFNAASYDDLMQLFDLFPGCAVEFSCYSQNVGTLPGRNTIFWEVRNY